MKKSLSLVSLFCLFTSTTFSQSTWLPEGDYRLYSAADLRNPLMGVAYSIASSDSISTRYTNYIQFSDFPGIIMQPVQSGYYTMMDSMSPFGDHIYYPQSDEVILFKMGIRLPNNPVSQHIYPCYTDSLMNFRIEAVSGNWTYSSEYSDSLLSFSLLVYKLNGQADAQHSLNAKTLTYGQTSGLISYPFALNKLAGALEQSNLLYSEMLNMGGLPKKPEDVFNYEAGNEFHSIRMERSYRLVDSSFIIRKTLAANRNGRVIERIDSVYQATYQYHYDSTDTWRLFGMTQNSKLIDTTLVDLDQFTFFGTNRTQTAVFPFDSTHNHEYFIVENNSAIYPFKLAVGRELPYASQLTPVPPYAYHAQRNDMIDDIAYSYYYPNAGGPYLRTSMGFSGEEETLMFIKDASGERGIPLNPSLVNSLQEPVTAEIGLYPNPATKNVHLQISEPGNWQGTIYTVQGQDIGVFSFDGDHHIIELSNFLNGVYFIYLTNGIYSGSARLIVTGGN